MIVASAFDPSAAVAVGVPVIEARGVSKHYFSGANFTDLLRGRLRGRRVEALRQLDLQVARGEVLAVLGENGAGKSTLLRLVSGLVIPDGGTLTVLGQRMVDAGPEHRSRACYVGGDERSFSWRLTGRQNLEFFAALHGIARARAQQRAGETLERVGLAREGDRPVREYSTGMRQRLALARGLLGGAELILLDEPTRGVDPGAALALRRFLKESVLAGECTALLATHDPEEARTLCRRAVLLKRGRLTAQGPVDEVLSQLIKETP